MSGDFSSYNNNQKDMQLFGAGKIAHSESTQDGDVLYRNTYPKGHAPMYNEHPDYEEDHQHHVRSLSGHFSGSAKLSDSPSPDPQQQQQQQQQQQRLMDYPPPQDQRNRPLMYPPSPYSNEGYNMVKPQAQQPYRPPESEFEDRERGAFNYNSYTDFTVLAGTTPPRHPLKVGQKHRRVFSGGLSNPVVAHRRINSGGSSAFIYQPRRVVPAPHPHHRRSSSDDEEEDLAAAIAGEAPALRHSRSDSPLSSYSTPAKPYPEYKTPASMDDSHLLYPHYQQPYPLENNHEDHYRPYYPSPRHQVISYNHPERSYTPNNNHTNNNGYYAPPPQYPPPRAPYYAPNSSSPTNNNNTNAGGYPPMRFVQHPGDVKSQLDVNDDDEDNKDSLRKQGLPPLRHRLPSSEILPPLRSRLPSGSSPLRHRLPSSEILPPLRSRLPSGSSPLRSRFNSGGSDILPPLRGRLLSANSCSSDLPIDTDEPLFSQKESIGTIPPSRIITAKPRASPTLFRTSLRDSQQSRGTSPEDFSGRNTNRPPPPSVPQLMEDPRPADADADAAADASSGRTYFPNHPMEINKHHRMNSSLTNISLGPGLFRDMDQPDNNTNDKKSSTDDFMEQLSPSCVPSHIKSENDLDGTATNRLLSPFHNSKLEHSRSSSNNNSPEPEDQLKGLSLGPRLTGNSTSNSSSKRIRRKCSVPECQNRVVQGGLCISHGAKRKTCGYPGCTKNVKKAGMCSAHGPARKKCEFEGCTKVAVQGGKCIAHGAKKKLCTVDGCTKQAILSGMCKKHHDKVHGVIKGGKQNKGTPTTSPETEERKQLSNGVYCVEVGSQEEASYLDKIFREDGKSGKRTHVRGLSIFQDMTTVDKILAGQDNDNDSKPSSSRSDSPQQTPNNPSPHHKRGLSIFAEDSVAESIIHNPSIMGQAVTNDEDNDSDPRDKR